MRTDRNIGHNAGTTEQFNGCFTVTVGLRCWGGQRDTGSINGPRDRRIRQRIVIFILDERGIGKGIFTIRRLSGRVIHQRHFTYRRRGAISHKRDFRRTAITVIHGRGNFPFTGNLTA